MIWTILGSGTSSGVPLIGCTCRVCRSRNPKNKRLRASVWVRAQGSQGPKSLIIDTSTDFRTQALREKIPRVDAVLYTHPHADHIYGIDDLRGYNFIQKNVIPVYGNDWTRFDLTRRFDYIFSGKPAEGGAISQLRFHTVGPRGRPMDIGGIPVIPVSLQHGTKECLGYRIHSVAYVTDCSYIPPESLDQLKGLKTLILDCVRLKPHNTHLHLDGALEVVEKVRPEKTYLTHLGHDFDHTAWSRKLPRNVALAYDGLKIRG